MLQHTLIKCSCKGLEVHTQIRSPSAWSPKSEKWWVNTPENPQICIIRFAYLAFWWIPLSVTLLHALAQASRLWGFQATPNELSSSLGWAPNRKTTNEIAQWGYLKECPSPTRHKKANMTLLDACDIVQSTSYFFGPCRSQIAWGRFQSLEPESYCIVPKSACIQLAIIGILWNSP